MLKYKLLTQDFTTHGGTRWKNDSGAFITVKAIGQGKSLCSQDVIHFYDHPVLAVLFNPIHANLKNPVLVSIEVDEEVAHDGLKGGCKQASIVEVLKLPEVTLEQRVEFAIRCAQKSYKNEKWRNWAAAWLSGKDRSSKSAHAARVTVSDDFAFPAAAAYAPADAAAACAANAAANADANADANAAAYAAYAADAAAYAAAYAARAANADKSKNLFRTVLFEMWLL